MGADFYRWPTTSSVGLLGLKTMQASTLFSENYSAFAQFWDPLVFTIDNLLLSRKMDFC
jgi:hypothetical protein